MKPNARETMERFLGYWQKHDWRKMKKLLQVTWMATHNRKEKKFYKKWFGDWEIEKTKIEKINRIGECMSDAECILFLKGGNEYNIRIRLVCEKKPYQPNINGKWGINPISCLKIGQYEQ
jgi:hypothetical protein